MSVLQRGGNAFDAAIAVAGVEWIDLPAQCGLGGDVFAVCYDAKEDRVVAINGSGESARAASQAQARTSSAGPNGLLRDSSLYSYK